MNESVVLILTILFEPLPLVQLMVIPIPETLVKLTDEACVTGTITVAVLVLRGLVVK